MLTIAGDHLRIPKGQTANLKLRAAILKKCRTSKKHRRAVMALCARDLIAFINLFVWQINPKHVGHEVGPFITWEFQDELLSAMVTRLLGEYPGDFLLEKSREMGATWIAMILAVWLCLFHRHKRVLCVSHTEHAVQKAGDDGTLFAKVDFILEHLPSWMTKGYKKSKLAYKFANGSTISGTASTERSGVGDRVTFVLLDEFSKQRDGYKIWGQTADTGPRLVIGTHYGVSGCFYDLTQKGVIPKFVMHWSLHPEKRRGLYRSGGRYGYEILDKSYQFPPDYNFVRDGRPTGGPEAPDGSIPTAGLRSPWYDLEFRKRANERDVAQHLDIAPAQSQANYFDLILVQTLADLCVEPVWQGTIKYDPADASPIALVKMQDGPLKLWVNLIDDLELPRGKYGAGADISMGVGTSNSVMSVGDALIGRKVAELTTADSDPRDFAMACVALLRLLKDYDGNTGVLAWETIGPGGLFGRTLQKVKYTRLFYRESKDMMRGNQISDIPGWNPNVQGAKRDLLDQYTIALRDRALVNLSKESFAECKHYRLSETKDVVEHPKHAGGPDPSGARSNHGDRVIADALMWMVMVRLGAGKYLKMPEHEKRPVLVGSFDWRWQMAQREDRQLLDRFPSRN